MGLRHPPIYIFSRGLWNKNTKPMTPPRRAAMMALQVSGAIGMTLAKTPRRQDAKSAKSAKTGF
jgi:hypothetical protein